MDAHEKNVKRMRHILRCGLSARQREIVHRHAAEIAQERHYICFHSAYPDGNPLTRKTQPPKAQEAPAKERRRGRGAATAASRRVAGDE